MVWFVILFSCIASAFISGVIVQVQLDGGAELPIIAFAFMFPCLFLGSGWHIVAAAGVLICLVLEPGVAWHVYQHRLKREADERKTWAHHVGIPLEGDIFKAAMAILPKHVRDECHSAADVTGHLATYAEIKAQRDKAKLYGL